MHYPTAKDTEGNTLFHGDEILFSFGTPSVTVRAKLRAISGELWALTPDHNPPLCPLSELEECVGRFEKA
jgi:hypothetical protein